MARFCCFSLFFFFLLKSLVIPSIIWEYDDAHDFSKYLDL